MSNYAGQYELASVPVRFVAIVIDAVILGLIGFLLSFVIGDLGNIVSMVIGLVYSWYFWTRKGGQTVGKQVMGIRVVKEDGGPLNDTDAILRYIGYIVNSFTFLIGWLWAIIDSKNQGFHDKIAKTYVVKA